MVDSRAGMSSKKIRTWARELPDEEKLSIVVRMALRTVPYIRVEPSSENFVNLHDYLWLTVFRYCFECWMVAILLNRKQSIDIRIDAKSVWRDDKLSVNVEEVDIPQHVSGMNAVLYAANILPRQSSWNEGKLTSPTSRHDTKNYFGSIDWADTIEKITEIASSVSDDDGVWMQLREDFSLFHRNMTTMYRPLWLSSINLTPINWSARTKDVENSSTEEPLKNYGLGDKWEEFIVNVNLHDSSDFSWFIDWFRHVMLGNKMRIYYNNNGLTFLKIYRSSREWWERGSYAVNCDIKYWSGEIDGKKIPDLKKTEKRSQIAQHNDKYFSQRAAKVMRSAEAHMRDGDAPGVKWVDAVKEIQNLIRMRRK